MISGFTFPEKRSTVSAATTWVDSLTLSSFRSYDTLMLQVPAGPVVITGPNGAGKTNILEALSFLAPGRGLRQAKLSHVTKLDTPQQGWTVHADIATQNGTERLGTGILPGEEKRTVRLNQTTVPHSTLSSILCLFWMTPQVDQLLNEGMGQRRRFFDKLVAYFYPEHTQHLYRYEYALRERSRLLRDDVGDDRWLSRLEEKMAQETLAIESLRQSFLDLVSPLCASPDPAFPEVRISLGEGVIQGAALEAEDALQQALRAHRQSDARTGGSKLGAHQTEIIFFHVSHKKKSEFCSTGEQKALLLSFILANARLHVLHKGRAPILLLDEVVAHLDEMRRESLCRSVLSLGLQTWMTGTDVSVFAPFAQNAHYIKINNGKLE